MQFANNAFSTVGTAINNVVTTLVLASGEGARFPIPSGGDYFLLTLTQATAETSWEIVKVTARSTDTLTIVRGQEGTTAASWGVGSKAQLRLTSGTMDFVASAKIIPQNIQSTAYTCVLDDSGKHILHPSADTTARTFTIPANASVAYPVGTAITFVNQASAGVMTIAITTDVMRLAGAGTTGSRTLAANGIATAIKLTSTEWIISGTNLT